MSPHTSLNGVYVDFDAWFWVSTEAPPPLQKATAETKIVRRSGGLPDGTHPPDRSMTLRPHLTMSLPFRLTEEDESHY
jgi:hypothetical protein